MKDSCRGTPDGPSLAFWLIFALRGRSWRVMHVLRTALWLEVLAHSFQERTEVRDLSVGEPFEELAGHLAEDRG